MRKLSEVIKEGKQKLDIQDDTINIISSEDLYAYLEIAKKFISEDAKNVITWLAEHPNYPVEIASPNADNAF